MHFSKSKVDSLDLSQIALSFISVNDRRFMCFGHVRLLMHLYVNTVLVFIQTYCINHLNVLPSAGDGTTLPLGDMASISRAFGRLIPPFERDSLLVLVQDLAKEDKVGFNREQCTKSAKEVDQSWIQCQYWKRVRQRRRNCQFQHRSGTSISQQRMCDLKGRGDFEPLAVASSSEPTGTTGHSSGSSFTSSSPKLHPYTLLIMYRGQG